LGHKATVLVVGGAGYIGSQTVKQLARDGHHPVTLDSLVTGHREAVLAGAFEEGNLTDLPFVRSVFARHTIDAVIHFAAYAYVGESVTDPAKYYENNVAATVALLKVMREAGVGRLIFSSTCATYGEPERVPLTEDHPRRPVNPYGRTKWMIEEILADYDRAYGLRSVVFRYFNAAGADPDGDIGERHSPETHLIPLAFEAIRTGKPLSVFGEDYPTSDGTCIRDYIHVSDLAQAHILGLERLLLGEGSAVFNLGNGRGYSVREVLSAVERVTGHKVPHVMAPRRPGDPAVLVGSAQKATAELGWRPAFADLEQIVGTAWRFHTRHTRAAH
jgi:UDP-glucose-4-epimerase GalE